MPTQPLAVRLGAPLKDRIRTLAEHKHRPVHWLMREAIEQYVTREELRESFRQDALNAWQEHQETGLHVTGDEVVAWLETWGTDSEQPAPICHE